MARKPASKNKPKPAQSTWNEFWRETQEFKRFGEVIVLLLFTAVSFLVIGLAISHIGADPSAVLGKYSDEIASFPSKSGFERFAYLGETIFPWVFMFALMLIARQIWQYRQRKERLAPKGVLETFYYYLFGLETLLNNILIFFVFLFTVIIVVGASALMLQLAPSDKMLSSMLLVRDMGNIIYKWVSMLAVVIIAREFWIINKRRIIK